MVTAVENELPFVDLAVRVRSHDYIASFQLTSFYKTLITHLPEEIHKNRATLIRDVKL